MDTPPAAPQRSEFVTVFAWINIVLGGMGVLLFFGLLALIAILLPPDEMLAAMQRPEVRQLVTPPAEFAVRHIQSILGVLLALSVAAIIASVALLRRKNWARLFWVAMMALIVALSVAGLFFHPDYSAMMPPEFERAPPEVRAQMKTMMESAKIYGYVLSVVQAVAFSLGVWYFCSAKIRREFQARD